MPANERPTFTDEEALSFHATPKPGKLEITPTKPMATQRDLSLAYSPGVAVPVRAIAENPDAVFDYTARGNMVAVITNGTAILGLGNLGAAAAKPVMEGKAVLFKRFADVDAVDLEVDTSDVDAFINCVRYLGPTFGGINLEDIRSPDCFIIEQQLREMMDIPVFHDDQHGTAIIVAAGLINAADITGRKLSDMKVVLNGPGAAGIATLELIKALGVKPENCIAVDKVGVLSRDRTDLNQWQSAHAVVTKKRTLAEALVGADVLIGVSAKGAVTQEMVKTMAKGPIIFAMANPDPEITPEEVKAVRPDAIVATGRSDYPNQVNNVLGFPYIFRGALDVRARTINEPMKIAAAQALAALAREDVPDEVAAAYRGSRPVYGPDYIIPVPFDPRLISRVSRAVAEAAIKTGVARRVIKDLDQYSYQLSARLDPSATLFQTITSAVRAKPKRVVFAEGENEAVIRAAYAFQNSGLGKPILVGRNDVVRRGFMANIGLDENALEIRAPLSAMEVTPYVERLYNRLQRRGVLYRDAVRMVTNDRNIYAAAMLAAGDADAMVTGVTRNYAAALNDVRTVIDASHGVRPIGLQVIFAKGRIVLVADTSITELPDSEQLADIAIRAAATARKLGLTPRVAMLASSTFGFPRSERSERIIEAVHILDTRGVDFEYDGEFAPDVALDRTKLDLYPFTHLTDTANVLVMPAMHSAQISTKLLQQLGAVNVMGPLLVGLEKSVQIAPLGAKMSEIYNSAIVAAYDIND